ncbi:hypothetical protein [Actinoplanes sp. NPDC049802]|uniref:hypothetical protein n=1 Tax=Actinoplanes sp. NPDC049802 TaxID=3154742 RepID=UPI0033DC1E1B
MAAQEAAAAFVPLLLDEDAEPVEEDEDDVEVVDGAGEVVEVSGFLVAESPLPGFSALTFPERESLR